MFYIIYKKVLLVAQVYHAEKIKFGCDLHKNSPGLGHIHLYCPVKLSRLFLLQISTCGFFKQVKHCFLSLHVLLHKTKSSHLGPWINVSSSNIFPPRNGDHIDNYYIFSVCFIKVFCCSFWKRLIQFLQNNLKVPYA